MNYFINTYNYNVPMVEKINTFIIGVKCNLCNASRPPDAIIAFPSQTKPGQGTCAYNHNA